MKEKILSVTLALCIVALGQGTFGGVQQAYADDTIKIMCVGDSITDGYWEQGGYRKYMYHALEENGITNVDMVGTKGMDEETYSEGGITFTYDGNYSGYSGYAIQYITGTETRQGILETMQSESMMETYRPDIVLLQIGTNDILSAYNDGIADRLENLCDYILSYLDTDSTLFVSTIPDMDVKLVYDWFWAYGSEYYGVDADVFCESIQGYVDTYNSSIKEMVSKKQAEGVTNVKFADVNSVVDYQTDLYDGIHPNERGYKKMGVYWCDILTEYLNGSEAQDPTVTTTSDPNVTTTSTITTTTELTDVTTTPTTTTSPTIVRPNGDLNLDGKVTSMDLLLLKRAVLEGQKVINYDVDGNYEVDSLDVVKLKSILLESNG